MLNARCMRRSSRVTRFTVALTALLALGVGSAREAQAQVSTLPLDFPDVVIFATNSARLQSDSQVVAGHVVVNNASPGPTLRGRVELGVGKHALTPAGFSLQVLSCSVPCGSNTLAQFIISPLVATPVTGSSWMRRSAKRFCASSPR